MNGTVSLRSRVMHRNLAKELERNMSDDSIAATIDSLNEKLVEPGYAFGMLDDDLVLMSDADWEQEGAKRAQTLLKLGLQCAVSLRQRLEPDREGEA